MTAVLTPGADEAVRHALSIGFDLSHYDVSPIGNEPHGPLRSMLTVSFELQRPLLDQFQDMALGFSCELICDNEIVGTGQVTMTDREFLRLNTGGTPFGLATASFVLQEAQVGSLKDQADHWRVRISGDAAAALHVPARSSYWNGVLEFPVTRIRSY
jgi:hypothetical protein